MHKSAPAALVGTVSFWKPVAPKGAFAFITLSSGEELFAPFNHFHGVAWDEMRNELPVKVFGIQDSTAEGRRRRAHRVEVIL